MKLNFLTIAQASKLLREGAVSSQDVTRACLQEISASNKTLNAFIRVFEKEAMAQAKASDARYKLGKQRGKLDGIPLAIKDNICLKGAPTTAGSKLLENFISPYEASVITKLRQAGAVFLGKTNMDEFAQGSSTENSAFGVTRNPHDIRRVPGGSSGGSAVAVASGMCLGALGSDTGGSIRLPASFCGVVGLKPSYGRVSRYGLIAMGSSLDQIGPLARTSQDAKIIFQAIAGHDPLDATSQTDEGTTKSASEANKIRLSVPSFHKKSKNRQINSLFEKVVKQLGKLRQIKLQEAPPITSTQLALTTYYTIMPVEVASNMARFDGIRFGYSAERDKDVSVSSLYDVYAKSRGSAQHGLGKEVKRRIIMGTYASSAGYADRYYHRAQKLRAKLQGEFKRAFSKTDILVSLVATIPAFYLGQKVQDPLEMYKTDILTVQANIVGIPAISLPIGYIKEDGKQLPIGIQIMAPRFRENILFKAGKIIERLVKQDGQSKKN